MARHYRALYAVARDNLERRDQRRVPPRQQHAAARAGGNLSAGDRRRADPVALKADRRNARRDAGELAGRSSSLSGTRRDIPGRLGARRDPRLVRLAGRYWRCDYRAARLAGRLFPGLAEQRGGTRRDRVEHLWLTRFHDRRRDRAGYCAGPVSVDRTEHPQHRIRALSERADPGLCGPELDPAARIVVAPTAPCPPTRSY